MAKPTIVICVGSSCFARGNTKIVELVEDYLKEHGLEDGVDVELSGSLCTGNCSEGPIVMINDKTYRHIDSGAMLDLLDGLFADKGTEK